jgi:peptidoglycan hydrolase-like protein with peptidoglycan-binding domain
MRIAIYAGHGGSDSGAVGNGFREADLNLAVMLAATRILRGWGYTVINNRTTDVNRSITADANRANAARVNATVEIHQNANYGTPGTGSEVIFAARDPVRSRALATDILRRLVALGFADRGVKTMLNASGQDLLGILRLTNMPAVLVESAFINNPADMARFNVEEVARAIAEGISSFVPISGGGMSGYPGSPIRIGAQGEVVRSIQRCLNRVAARHPAIGTLTEDGNFGPMTQNSVMAFQRIFGLNPDGVVGPLTWDRLARECASSGGGSGGGGCGMSPYPGTPLRVGSAGNAVREVQRCLNKIAERQPTIGALTEDGLFGQRTQASVIEFQRIFGLTQDGVVGANTWERLARECACGIMSPYPGTALRVGSSGDYVRQVQQCLNQLASRHPSIGRLVEDGRFGPMTQASVMAFQRVFGLNPDGVVGPITWGRLVTECGSK